MYENKCPKFSRRSVKSSRSETHNKSYFASLTHAAAFFVFGQIASRHETTTNLTECRGPTTPKNEDPTHRTVTRENCMQLTRGRHVNLMTANAFSLRSSDSMARNLCTPTLTNTPKFHMLGVHMEQWRLGYCAAKTSPIGRASCCSAHAFS